MRIGVIGAGAFGTALAVALSKTSDVRLWGRGLCRDAIESPRLPGVRFPQRLQPVESLVEATATDILLLATPMAALGEVQHQLPTPLPPAVLCCKGVDPETLTGPATAFQKARPDAETALLTGPSFAVDIAAGLPTALTLAGPKALVERLQPALTTPTLRLYTTDDVIGAELGGALKNVMAIAAGVAIGAGLGDSARAALITRGFAEMQRFAETQGGRPDTLHGLSGLGDLLLTATSAKSRNYSFGLALGAARDLPQTTVEGRATAITVAAMATSKALDLPITQTVAALITGRIDVTTAVKSLMSRPLKEERCL